MYAQLKLFKGGFCTHKEKAVLRGGRDTEIRFPSLFALIAHPKEGYILFDTGYSSYFLEETQRYPNKLYAKVTPVSLKPEESAVAQLSTMGIAPEDIKYIVISHFHGDHVAGLKDFPQARFVCLDSGYTEVKKRKGIAAVRKGILPGLIPGDFESRTHFLSLSDDRYRLPAPPPFEAAFDLFGDGLLRFIPLEGHFKGQVGVLIQLSEHKNAFLIADACWLSPGYKELILPSRLALLVMNNPLLYRQNLEQIHRYHKMNPNDWVIPSHCTETIDAFSCSELHGIHQE